MESKEKTLVSMIKEIDSNQLMLPNFQRSYNWKIDEQKALIASFLYDIPIGSILLLNQKTDMGTKKIGYIISNPSQDADNKQISYLMDGQQRLTTLKSVFDDFFKNYHNDNKIFDKVYHHLKNRWFLKLNIFDRDNKIEESNLKVILDLITKGEISDNRSVSDVKELIAQVKIIKTGTKKPYHPLNLKSSNFRHYLENNQYLALFLLLPIIIERGTDLSNKYKKLLIEPTQKIFEEKWFGKIKENPTLKRKFETILKDYKLSIDWDNQDKINEISTQWSDEIYNSLRQFLTETRKLFTISYSNSFSKAVEAFTAMNTGGLSLSTFDIIVAKYATLRKDELLKDRIERIFKKTCEEDINLLPKIDTNNLFNHLSNDKSQDTQKFYHLYLNMLAILNNGKNNLSVDCIKETNKLSLIKDNIDKHTNKAISSIAFSFRFLSGYCGISKITDISYQGMILPIAYHLYDIVKEQNNNSIQKFIYKIFYWYWVSIFGGRYREKQSSRSVEDITNLSNFLKKEDHSKITKIEGIFDDQNYSDFESLKNQETKSLEGPILKFIFVNKILDEKLNHSSEVVKRLQNNDFEKSHLISLDEYKKKTRNPTIKRNTKHYIHSVFNLAFLPKPQNRFDRSKSWYEWNHKALEKEKLLIPKKIKFGKDNLDWNSFNEQMRDSNPQTMQKLSESFIKARFEEIKKTVKDRLNKIKKQI